jgi:hypothetical protein
MVKLTKKFDNCSGFSGATLKFRIIPVFVTDGRLDLAKGLSLGFAFVVRDSSDRRDGSGC